MAPLRVAATIACDGRHAELDQPFDGDDRAEAVVLLGKLRRARQFGRRGPVAVGARRHAAAGANQLLRVLPPHLEILADLGGFLAFFRRRLLARRRSPFLLRFGAFFLDFVLRLEMPLPRRTGDRAGEHRAVQAAIDDRRDEVVRHLAAVEQLGVLDAVDAGGDRHPEAFDARRMRFGGASALVRLLDDHRSGVEAPSEDERRGREKTRRSGEGRAKAGAREDERRKNAKKPPTSAPTSRRGGRTRRS